MGITLDELRKKAQKQIKKKNYLGYFQKFNAGNVPLNNAMFNSIMDTSDSEVAGDISGVGEADGGVGMVGGAMGEDLEIKKEEKQIPEEEETVTFYYTSKNESPDDAWYQVETDKVVVGKEDVIQALLALLRYTEYFAYMDDSEFEQAVRNHWRELKDEYYEELFNLFNQNMVEPEEENFTDEFYDDNVVFDYESEEEPDSEFTSTEFEDIDSEDPTFTPNYDNISKYDLIEDFDIVAFDKLLISESSLDAMPVTISPYSLPSNILIIVKFDFITISPLFVIRFNYKGSQRIVPNNTIATSTQCIV